MDETKATGAEYPTIEVGGVSYELKFTRGLMYRMNKAGIVFNPQFREGKYATCNLANFIDVLHMAISFKGTAEELTELVYDKRGEIMNLLVAGWGKVVLPSLKTQIAAAAANKPSDQQPVVQ